MRKNNNKRIKKKSCKPRQFIFASRVGIANALSVLIREFVSVCVCVLFLNNIFQRTLISHSGGLIHFILFNKRQKKMQKSFEIFLVTNCKFKNLIFCQWPIDIVFLIVLL